jgi:predicted AAA+ superfamily ATPase
MYTRSLIPEKTAFFLLGPRGTGKSTWIRSTFPLAFTIDLLPSSTALNYQKNPGILEAEVRALSKDTWIVLDEIQKVPALLDEVHNLMENHGFKKFVLTGSSARKLKRGGANLLAGRAHLKTMYPLTAAETKFAVPIEQSITYGLLPMSVDAENNSDRELYLTSYVETYLNQEIKYEGLVRNIGSFANFLEVATLTAGQQINISALARDAGISRDTVRGYYSVFEDTLLGTWLPAYRPRAKIKEVIRPKFYWFDPGVLNAAAGAFKQPMPMDWKGILFEHLVHHELSAYLAYTQSRGTLGFWKTSSGSEIDFLWWYGGKCIGIEVKSAKEFRPEFLKGIRSFNENKQLSASYVVYRGERDLKVDDTWVLSADSFLQRLHRGEIVGFWDEP